MARLFDYDNPVWKVMGRVADLFLLTILWFLCSIPIVTIGASTTALYYVALKMARNQEEGIFKSYFRCMRENFVSSTIVWLILAVVMGILGAEFYLQGGMELRRASFFFWMWAVFALLYLLLITIIFPLSARLDTGVVNLFFMAFMVTLKHLSWVFFMAVCTVCIIAAGIFVFWPLLLFAAGAIAFLHGLILEFVIFPKYNWTGGLGKE